MKIDFPSERIIEDYVWSELERNHYCPISDEYFDMFFRQQEIKGYGITDIIKISFDGSGGIDIRVLELKNETLKESHVSQLCRYMEGIGRVAHKYFAKLPSCPEIHVTGELAGPFDKSRGDFVYLLSRLEDIQIYDVSLSMGGGFSSEIVLGRWFDSRESFTAYKGVARKIASGYQDAVKEFEEQLRYGHARNVVNMRGGSNA